MSAAEDPEALTEELRVFLRRYEEARRASWCQVDARLFAESTVDVGLLRKLKEAGCSARMAAKILL